MILAQTVRMRRRLSIAVAMLAVLAWGGTVYAAEKNDPRTLCPRSGSEGQTLLLIDTTDQLTPPAKEQIKNVFKAFLASDNDHYLQPKHELLVYQLTPDLGSMDKPLLRVCNPGNPDDRTWTDNLGSGTAPAKRMWSRYKSKVIQAYHKVKTQHEAERSPLLESIAIITARHAPTIGVSAQGKPTRLIVFSDMLQHSDYLSHYRTLPDMKAFSNMTGYASMRSKLDGVDVWIFYVQRSGLENRQTTDHYYWWTRAIELFGGRLIEQTPL